MPILVTLHALSSLAVVPSTSGLKRSRVNPAGGAGEEENTSTSGSGCHVAERAAGAGDATPLPNQEPFAPNPELSPEFVRKTAVVAFVTAPLLPEPDHSKVDQISAFAGPDCRRTGAQEGHQSPSPCKLPGGGRNDLDSVGTSSLPIT